MRFPNAYDGIKRIHTAEILNIAATAALSIAGAMITYEKEAGRTFSAFSFDSLGGIASYITLAGFAAAIAAGILYIKGILQAEKDEPSFKTPMISIAVSIAASVVSSIFQANSTVAAIADLIRRLADIVTFYLMVQAILSLAAKTGNKEVRERGMYVRRLSVTSGIVAMCLTVGQEYLVRPDTPGWVVVFAVLVAGVILIYAHVLFIGLLGKAEEMIKNDNKVNYKKMKR